MRYLLTAIAALTLAGCERGPTPEEKEEAFFKEIKYHAQFADSRWRDESLAAKRDYWACRKEHKKSYCDKQIIPYMG